MALRQRVHDLPSLEKAQYDSINNRFDAAWGDWPDSPPAIEDYLPESEPLRSLVLVALVKTDFECRRKKGQPVTVDDYLSRFPELRSDTEYQVELLVWDWQISGPRQENLEQFLSRFPHLESQLRPRLVQARPAERWMGPPGFSDLQEIGRGSMGVVYSAWQDSLKRYVAVKVLSPALTRAEDALARFHKEARIVASLNHPNIVKIHAIEEFNRQPYCVFELCHKKSLDDKLRSGPFEPDTAARLVVTIAEAVQAAHNAGVIHRDLKPANVLFTIDDTVKVADFGLARRLDDARMTRTGDVIGTISYAAPEQLGAGEVTKLSDVYALGSILYHCLTGRPPFLGATLAETYYQVLTRQVVKPSRLANVPRDLETVCLMALEKDPRHRYQSPAELADDLQRFLAKKPIRARPASVLRRLGLWCRRNRALASAISITALALLGLIVSFGLYERRAVVSETRLGVLSTLTAWDTGRRLCEDGDVGYGLLWLARALEATPRGDKSLQDALRIELAGWHGLCHTLHGVWEHPDKVIGLAVTQDGKTAATCCGDGKIRLWNVNSGHSRELNARHGDVTCLAFSRLGDTLITGGANGEIHLWNAATGTSIASLGTHAGEVHSVALSPDGSFALSGGADKTACLWDLSKNTCIARLDHQGPVRVVAFECDGRSFLTGSDKRKKGEMRLYETREAQRAAPFFVAKFDKKVRSAAFSTDRKTLLVGDEDWEATFWDLESREQFAAIDVNGSAWGVAFAPNGKTALTGADESAVAHLWDASALHDEWLKQNQKCIIKVGKRKGQWVGPKQLGSPLYHPAPVLAVAFVNDDTFLTACEDGCVRVWHTAPPAPIQILPHNPKKADIEYQHKEHVVLAVAFHPDPLERLAATAGSDGKVKIWKVPPRLPDGAIPQPDKEFVHPENQRVTSIAFTPDGRTVLSGCDDGHVRFWDLATGQVVGQPLEHTTEVWWLSMEGDLILTGGDDGRAYLWDAKSRQPIGEPVRHGLRMVTNTAIAPNKRQFLTGSLDGIARIWDENMTLMRVLQHQNAVRGVNFSRDGTKLVTASDDRIVRVWGVTGNRLYATLSHRSEVRSAVFTLDGKRVLTGSKDDGIQLWDIQSQRRVGPNYLHHEVMHVALSPDGRIAALADWNGNGVLYSLPVPVQGDPGRLGLWVHASVGMKLDDGGGLHVLSGSSWRQIQQQVPNFETQEGGRPIPR